MAKGSQYPRMTNLTGSERLLGVQGTATEAVTLSDVADFAAVQAGAVTPDVVNAMVTESLGFYAPVEYEAGLLMDDDRQTVTYNGDTYAPVADQLPFTTGALFDPGQWRLVQGITVADLSASTGSLMVGFSQPWSWNDAFSRSVAQKLRETVSIKDFGAVGDYTEHPLSEFFGSLAAAQERYPFVTSLDQSIDWAAWSAAIDYLASIGGGTLRLPNGGFVSTGDDFVVDEPRINIVCEGWIVDSTVHIGMPYSSIGPGNALTLIDFIGNFKMRCTESDAARAAINLQYARNVKISGEFYNYQYGVRGLAGNNGEVFGQMNARVKLFGVEFYNCTYPVSTVRNTESGPVFQHADWAIDQMLCLPATAQGERTIRNISIEGMDGLTLDNAYLFMPGVEDLDPYKEENVYIERSTNVILGSNVQYFEAGKEAIRLHMCQFFTINGGVIQFPGQRVPSDAVAITGGDPNGAEFVCGYIGGITGFASSKNFIGIYDNCGYIQVAPNQFRSVKAGNRYYGADPLPATAYGVFADTGTTEIQVARQNITGGIASRLDAVHLLGTNSTGGYMTSGLNGFTSGLSAPSYRQASNTNRGIYWATSVEGVVTAPPGSMVLREAGGANATAFLKVSGSGNTGWEAITTTRSGSKTYDPGSIAAGGVETTTVSCPGAALGGFAWAAFSLDLQGVVLSAYVSAADTVTVVFRNTTGSTVDLASGTLRVRVSNN